MQSRRDFIKNSCISCIAFSTLGVLIESCATQKNILKSSVENNTLKVSLDNFITSNSQILRNASLPFDILVVKSQAQYTALQMRCTHNDVALSFSGKKLVCASHGSEFDLNGNVTKEPAVHSLTQYKTSINNNFLHIHLK